MPLKLLGHLAQPLTCWSEKEWPSWTSPKTLPTFLSPGQGSTFLRESLSCSNASCRWFLGNLCSKSSLIWGTAPREPAANLSLHSMNAGGEYDFFFFLREYWGRLWTGSHLDISRCHFLKTLLNLQVTKIFSLTRGSTHPSFESQKSLPFSVNRLKTLRGWKTNRQVSSAARGRGPEAPHLVLTFSLLCTLGR